ncbi:MAG: DUF2631 domain-containing protein [Pseudonocardiaceae bacterium]|nr:DUF2631 domain-containing protein [Pseudonocardiaceae bacterium]
MIAGHRRRREESVVAVPSSSTGEQEHAEPAPRDHESHGAQPQHDAQPHGVDADEPSAEWGWHGSFPTGRRIAGWVTVVGLFSMAFFDHGGISETWWLAALASVVAMLLIRNEFKQRPAALTRRR